MEYVNSNLKDVINLDDLIELLSSKQDLLISGTNIKTVDGQSILGQGNVSFVGLHNTGLTVVYPLGGIRYGYEFPEGTTLEEIIRKLLGGSYGVPVLNQITYEEIPEDNT